jgi:hypothetical protein
MFKTKTKVCAGVVFGLGLACTVEGTEEDRLLQSAESFDVGVETLADRPHDGQGVHPNDCCLFHQTPGCDDAEIEACVCAFDPFCCTVAWDGFCISEAISDCGLNCGLNDLRDKVKDDGGDAGYGDDGHDDDGHDDDGHDDDGHEDGKEDDDQDCFDDCCTPSADPGCENSEIEQCVCAFDSFCCIFLWDWLCVEGAIEQCGAQCDDVKPVPEDR